MKGKYLIFKRVSGYVLKLACLNACTLEKKITYILTLVRLLKYFILSSYLYSVVCNLKYIIVIIIFKIHINSIHTTYWCIYIYFTDNESDLSKITNAFILQVHGFYNREISGLQCLMNGLWGLTLNNFFHDIRFFSLFFIVSTQLLWWRGHFLTATFVCKLQAASERKGFFNNLLSHLMAE